MAMGTFNINQYTEHKAAMENSDLKKEIQGLKSKLNWFHQMLEDNKDGSVSYTQEIQHLENVIYSLKKQKFDVPNKSEIIQKVISKYSKYTIPDNYNFSFNNPNIFFTLHFPVTKNHAYILTATTKHADKLFLSTRDNEDYIGDMRIVVSPSNNKGTDVKFIKSQHDDGKNLKLEFKALTTGTVYVLPINKSTLYNYRVVECYYPQDKANNPADKSIPTPNDNSGLKAKVDKNVVNWLRTLLGEAKQGKIVIPSIWHSLDQNGSVSYKFTANVPQKEWSFSDAVNKLGDTNGMYRISWTKNLWVELDSTGNLAKKYRGNNQLFPYSPTKDDIDGKDWVVTSTRPFNPNTYPHNSNPFDDADYTDNFGYDGSNDYYTGYYYSPSKQKKSSGKYMNTVNYLDYSDIPSWNDLENDEVADDTTDLDSQYHKLHYEDGNFTNA